MAAPRKRGDKTKPLPAGQLRQSQFVTTFGPGAMVDLVDRAVVIGGLEHWGYGKASYVALDDPRLRRSLLPRRLRAIPAPSVISTARASRIAASRPWNQRRKTPSTAA